MIAITGANGNLGQFVVYHLLQKTAASKLVAIVRNPQTAESFKTDISDTLFREELLHHSLPLEVADLLVSMANGIKAGEFSHSEGTLEKLLGRKPLELNEYIKKL